MLTHRLSFKAAMLGDPNFPQKAMDKAKEGKKIALCQSVYKLYSRLAFSYHVDRPIAILGIEKRLLLAFDVQGGYGIFGDRNGTAFFYRSLLWQRAGGEPSLRMIDFPPVQSVLTWSWMAYEGAIDYLNLPVTGVDWVEREIEITSPWHQYSGTETWSEPTSSVELSALVYRFMAPLDLTFIQGNNMKIIYDIPGQASQNTKEIKCVVLGKLRITASPDEPLLVVMLVLEDGERGGYRRIGVGIVPGASISLEPV
jgi:hypothetical protein